MKLRISEIRQTAMKHPGLWNDLFLHGRRDGEFLEIGREIFDQVMAKYFPKGAGSMLHKALTPVIAVVDSVAGTNLADCGGCAERELKLNG